MRNVVSIKCLSCGMDLITPRQMLMETLRIHKRTTTHREKLRASGE